jgi:hypothetical protein
MADLRAFREEFAEEKAKMNATIKEHMQRLSTLEVHVDILTLDHAVIFAAQLVSRVLGYERKSARSRACEDAIRWKNDSAHWGKNFAEFMKNFTANHWQQLRYAQDWDNLRNTGTRTAHPDMFDAHNEEMAKRFIENLERRPRKSGLANTVLFVLRNRNLFLAATPCRDSHRNYGV